MYLSSKPHCIPRFYLWLLGPSDLERRRDMKRAMPPYPCRHWRTQRGRTETGPPPDLSCKAPGQGLLPWRGRSPFENLWCSF